MTQSGRLQSLQTEWLNAATTGHTARPRRLPVTGRSGPTEGDSERQPTLVRKLQRPLDCLEARLVTQGIEERVGLEELHVRKMQPHRRVQ